MREASVETMDRLVGSFACGERVAGVEARTQRPLCNRFADLARTCKRLIPVVLDGDTDGGRFELDETGDERRRHARHDDVGSDRRREIERPNRCIVGAVVEPARADGAHLDPRIFDHPTSLGGIIARVAEPELDPLEAECDETLERVRKRQRSKRKGVAGEPHSVARSSTRPSVAAPLRLGAARLDACHDAG
jgi:hypothetical protein